MDKVGISNHRDPGLSIEGIVAIAFRQLIWWVPILSVINISHTNTELENLMEPSLISNYLFYSCFFLKRLSLQLLTQGREALQLRTLLAVLYNCKILTLLQSFVLFLLRKARTTQPIYGDVAVSFQGKICAKDIWPWDNYNLNIIAYSQSQEYCPAEVCGGHHSSLALPVTFSVRKKLRCKIELSLLSVNDASRIYFFHYTRLLYF